MSKGKNLTKRKWKDFRRKGFWDKFETIGINCPNKFPRSSKFLKRFKGPRISIRKHLYKNPYYFV